jgi:hypothetical protein
VLTVGLHLDGYHQAQVGYDPLYRVRRQRKAARLVCCRQCPSRSTWIPRRLRLFPDEYGSSGDTAAFAGVVQAQVRAPADGISRTTRLVDWVIQHNRR